MKKVLLKAPESGDSWLGSLAARSDGGHLIEPQQKLESSGGSRSWVAEVPVRQESETEENSEFVTRMWETVAKSDSDLKPESVCEAWHGTVRNGPAALGWSLVPGELIICCRVKPPSCLCWPIKSLWVNREPESPNWRKLWELISCVAQFTFIYLASVRV